MVPKIHRFVRECTNVAELLLGFLVLNNKKCSFNSDGGGRSGVYIAIDANLEMAEEEETFFLFGYLKKLKQSRKGLIESVVKFFVKN